MKKKIMNIVPYILGLLYLAYCLNNVTLWVTSHMDEHMLYIMLSWLVAAVLLVLKLLKKINIKIYLPIFYFAIGLIVYIVASGTPCCIGG